MNPVSEPPIYKIERWWSGRVRGFLRHLRAAIAAAAGRKGPVEDLLNVAFCRTLIKLSNDAFNHQSMSFRNPAQCKLDLDLEDGAVFLDDLAFVLTGAERPPVGDAAVILGDARNLPACLGDRFDVVVTSPPYANVLYSRTSSLHVLA